MRQAVQDLRQSWRIFRRNPGLALAAVVALALGIGFTTTMFGIVHGGTRSLPFEDPDELVAVAQIAPATGAADLDSRPFEIRRWQQTLTSFDGLGAYLPASVNVSGAGNPPERVPAAWVTPGTFDTLGVAPSLGRGLAPSDAAPGAPPVAVIGHRLWQTRFAGDPAILTRDMRLDGEAYRVVGVMPPGFGFPIRARVWLPLALPPSAAPGEGPQLDVFGRLRDGVSAADAATELSTDLGRLATESPVFEDRAARVFPFTEIETPAELRRGLQLLVAVVSLVLLVACANVANLLLARAAARARDTAIRSALGASRRRLVGQQLAESVLLAAAAAVAGLAIASAGLRFFATASAAILDAFWVDISLDPVVVAFATALGLFAAVTAGLVPALRASSAGAGALLQSQGARVAGPRIGRLGRGLVVAQLTMACGLLVVTTTLVSAAGAMRLVDIPFDEDAVLTADLSVLSEVLADPDTRARLITSLRDRLAAEPELGTAALVSVLPGRGAGQWSFAVTDDPSRPEPRTTGVAMVTPELFDLAGTGPLRGRLLSWQDDAQAPRVAVVNESFVRRHLADREDPIGRRLRLGTLDLTVVGVVPDLLMQDIEDVDGAGLYVSMLQARPYAVRVMTQPPSSPLAAVPALRRAIAAADPDLPVLGTATLRDAIFEDKRVLDALALLFLSFGAGAIFMAALGLHAVLSFVVTQRTREFGVRMALGASAADIVRLVLRRGGLELAWGLALGLGLAAALSRLLAATLERVPPAGLEALGAIAAAVLLASVVALYRPVRRAVRLDPLEALRHE